jgi:hypothetical protein
MRALAKHFSGGAKGAAARRLVMSHDSPPPEKFSPLRVDEFFDLPSGEMGAPASAPGATGHRGARVVTS